VRGIDEPLVLNYWFHVPREPLGIAGVVNHPWACQHSREVGPCAEDATLLDCRVSLPLTGKDTWSMSLRWQSVYNLLSIDHIGSGEGWNPRVVSVYTEGATVSEECDLLEGLDSLTHHSQATRTVEVIHVASVMPYQAGRREAIDMIRSPKEGLKPRPRFVGISPCKVNGEGVVIRILLKH